MTAHGWRRLLAILLLLPASALATVKETVTVDAMGMGGSRDEAISAALAQAVIQVQGRSVPPDILAKIFLDSMRDERRIRMTVLNDHRVRATRLSAAVAFVQDYQVMESTRQKEGDRWQAKVNAEVVSPKARLAKRQQAIKLAVLPFNFMQEEEAEAGGPDTQRLMVEALKNIKKFQSMVTASLDGQNRVNVRRLPESGNQDYSAAAENPGQANWPALTQQTTADNFVTVQIEEFRLNAVEMRRGVKTGRLDGKFVFHYRLIRNSESQPEIIKSGTFTIDTHHPQLKPIAVGPASGKIVDAEVNERVNVGYQRVARLFADALLAELLPPDVVAREGDNVVLQNGARALRIGDKLAALGPDISEPDTGTGLLVRQDGVRIAILEVTSTDSQRVLARVVKGNVFGVQPGCLLRLMNGASLAADSRHGTGLMMAESRPGPD